MLDARVGEQRRALTDERHAAGLQHVAAIAQLEGFHHALLDEQDREPARASNGGDRFEDHLDDPRTEALRRLVEEEERWGDPRLKGG